MLDRYKIDWPESRDGDWRVERFTVTPEQAALERLRASFSFGSRGRAVPEGTYTRLTRNGWLVMSDTPDEIRDHLTPIHRAEGHVLVNGLGLGLVARACLEKPEVLRVTAVEIAPEVIRLVGTHLRRRYGQRFVAVVADALTWQPPRGARYDVVWHDIWDDICADNLEDMKRLHRRYGRRCGWQGSWARARCEAQR